MNMFLLTFVFAGCVQQSHHKIEKLSKPWFEETIQYYPLKSLNIVITDFREKSGGKKILYLEDVIIEENSQWFNFVNRSIVRNYTQYLSLIYQEFILNYEGYVPKDNRLKVQPQRLIDIEKKLIHQGKKRGFTDTVINNTLNELKKSETFLIHKDGSIPSALLPKFGQIFQADMILKGHYHNNQNASLLSITLEDIETGNIVFTKDFQYSCTSYFCKKELARSILQTLKKSFPKLSGKIHNVQPEKHEIVFQIDYMHDPLPLGRKVDIYQTVKTIDQKNKKIKDQRPVKWIGSGHIIKQMNGNTYKLRVTQGNWRIQTNHIVVTR